MKNIFQKFIRKSESTPKIIKKNSLDELVEYLDTMIIPEHYQCIEIQYQGNLNLTYIDDYGYAPICDKEVLIEDLELIESMAMYHIFEKKEFYCGISEGNPTINELQLFGDKLIKKHFKLIHNETLIIPNPQIMIPSMNKIAFPIIYDKRTYTPENLKQLKKEFKI